MVDKLIYILKELKDLFSEEKMDEVLSCLDGEMTINDFNEKQGELREAINNQHNDFYNLLSIEFVSDLNERADLYFLFWENFLGFFTLETKCLFFEQALQNANNTDATDYINGLIELDNQRPEIALFHFNRIDDYVASYFIGLCYFDLDNFENTINNNLFFLENFEATIDDAKISISNLKESFDYLLVKYNVHNDLAYCYNRIEDYSNAYKEYEKVLKSL